MNSESNPIPVSDRKYLEVIVKNSTLENESIDYELSEEELIKEEKQRELDRKYQEENFSLLDIDYRDKLAEGISSIDYIAFKQKLTPDEKYSKIMQLGIVMDIDAMMYKSNSEIIKSKLDEIRTDALKCLNTLDEDGNTIPGDFFSNGDSDIYWLIENCIIDKFHFIQQMEYSDLYDLYTQQIVTCKYYLQSIMGSITVDVPKEELIKSKITKNTKTTSFSLATTVALFELLRDINVISCTNVKLSESIGILTGFSTKQAVNQFSENAKKENIDKLKGQLRILLENLLNRLE